MNKKQQIPFQNLTKEGWINLGLAALVTFYIILIADAIRKLTTCESIVIDYCAFWSAGRIINDHGIASVYDFNLLQKYQRDVFHIQSGLSFQPFAIMYLPIFILPFQLLSLINLQFSYLIWIIINLVGLILYLRYFTKSILGNSLPIRLLLIFLLPLPVFYNFYEGQVNLLMVIGVGEFIRGVLSDKHIKAGLWLGSLLIKPQFLILFLPFLLIQGKLKVLIGFLISFLATMMISLFMIDIEGFIKLFNILAVSAEGGFVSNPWAQMNWRMIGEHLTLYTSSSFGLTIAIIGVILTAGVSLFIIGKKMDCDDDLFVIVVLGLLAATGSVAWHAHLHSSIILIPPLLYLFMKNQISRRLLLYWVFVPVLALFIGSFVMLLGERGILQDFIHQLYLLVNSMVGFIFNMVFLIWALVRLLRSDLLSQAINSTEKIDV